MGPLQSTFAHSCFFILFGALIVVGEHRYKAHRRPRSTFLGAVNTAKLNRHLRHAVNDSLGNELNPAHMAVVKAEINPMWQSLAKDAHGRVDLRSLRYALQRYMHKKYHVSIVGLELGVSEHSHSAAIMSHAPELVANILHGNIQSVDNFQIDDLVATIGMLEQLLVHSGSDMLKAIYHKFGFDLHGVVSRDNVNQLLDSYLLRWILSDDPAMVREIEANMHQSTMLPMWPDMVQFIHGLADGFEYARAKNLQASQHGSQWRPLRSLYSFADVSNIVGHLPLSYGEFWRDECDKVKDALLKFDYQSTGRVKLSDFHGAALDGEWRFSESKEYLRKLGALDESSVHHGPRVIIPNYIHGPSNCIVSDTRYRVCCYNDCESYMDDIEESIASPTATPEELLEIISKIATSVDDVESAITPPLKSQLSQIAQLHNGQIPVHGRLFAQWLHYVFPRDCPFPHKAGAVTKMSPMEFGNGYLANDTEMKLHAEQNQSLENKSDHSVASHGDWMSQWSQDEELVTGDFDLKAPWEGRSSGGNPIAALFFFLLLLIVIGFGRKVGSEKAVVCLRPKEHLV